MTEFMIDEHIIEKFIGYYNKRREDAELQESSSSSDVDQNNLTLHIKQIHMSKFADKRRSTEIIEEKNPKLNQPLNIPNFAKYIADNS